MSLCIYLLHLATFPCVYVRRVSGLYFTVFPVEVDENVVDDDMRGRIKSRIEEEIWQKLKVSVHCAPS